MANTIRTGLILALAGVMIAMVFAAIPADAAFVSGAIHTSLYDGSAVNQNTYQLKTDVYLTGGPGPNAPVGAAGLPDGWYFFQVTDPSGKNLLSEDSIYARQFLCAGGIPVEYKAEYPGGNVAYLSTLKGKALKEATLDITPHLWYYNYAVQNAAGQYAICIQLMPYSDSPIGVYKVWATPQAYFDLNGGGKYGFIPSYCKTDNYKVLTGDNPNNPPDIPISTYLTVEKYYDANANGVIDTSIDTMITGWKFEITDSFGVTNIYYSPILIDLAGEFAAHGKTANTLTITITEIIPSTPTWFMTGLIKNGVSVDPFSTTVTVTITQSTTTQNNDVSFCFLNVAVGYNPGTARTPGYWQGPNGQDRIGSDDLTYLNGLTPFLTNYPLFYPVDLPFDSNIEVANFLVDDQSSKNADGVTYASIPEFKLAKFYLAMQLNVFNGFLDGDLALYLGNGKFITIDNLFGYIEDGFPWWDTWTDTEVAYYHNLLDSMCNNNVVYAYPTCPPIVYP